MTFDDSALFHGVYDPVKAREYYLKTRKLKGRKPTTATKTSPGRGGRRPANVPAARPKANPQHAKARRRRAELQAEKERLEKRLDRLREVLAEAVKDAKKRGGNKKKEAEKGRAPETPVDKADRNKAEKSRKPETASQKRERAKKAKERYKKENPVTLSDDIEVLREQIKDIQAKIQKAVADARDRRNKAGMKDQRSGAKTDNNGPRGR